MSNIYTSPTNFATQVAANNLRKEDGDFYTVPAKFLTGAFVNSAFTVLGAAETTILTAITLLASPLLLIDNSLSKKFLPEKLVTLADSALNSATSRTSLAASATFAALKGIIGIYPAVKKEVNNTLEQDIFSKLSKQNPGKLAAELKKSNDELLTENKFLKKDLEATREQSNMKAKIIRDNEKQKQADDKEYNTFVDKYNKMQNAINKHNANCNFAYNQIKV